MGQDEHERIVEELRSSRHDFIKVAVTDIDGILRGKYLHRDKLLGAIDNGFGFCNVVLGWDLADECYDDATYTGWHTGYPDADVRLDLGTLRYIPWEDDRPMLLGEFVDGEGQPLELCPRQTLRRILQRLADAGFEAAVGIEFEWFNFAETPASINEKGFRDLTPISPGMFGYSIIRQQHNPGFFQALLADLLAYRVPLEGLHTETGPGVFEAAILYSGGLEAADRAALFKTAAKEIGARFGVMPTFMARFNAELPGCSGHHHQSLRDASGANAFHDANDPHRMSQTFKSFLAGQLRYLGELLPMVAPTVNSYKRLVDGYWAPTKPTWGIDNRTVALRVIPGSEGSTRLETRLPGSDVNPYLSAAACLGAGLLGIEEGLELEAEPIVGSGYDADVARYARTLAEATEQFRNSEAATDLFGAAFVDHFATSRSWEWRRFGDAVTDWELARYFEII